MINALMQLVSDNKSAIQVISDGNNAVTGQYYFASDTDEYGFGAADGTIRWVTNQGTEPIQGVASTDSVAMTEANGIISATVEVSSAANNILVSDGNGLSVPDLQVAAGSQSRLSYDAASRTIAITALGMNTVHTDTTSADLAAFVAASYTAGNEYQEGDVIILTQESKAYIHDGGTAGTADDFTLLETPGLSTAEVQAMFSSGNAGITYANGVFTLTLDPSADNDLSIEAGGLMLDVSAALVTDTNNIVGGGSQTIQDMFDSISAIDHFQGFNISAENNDIDIDNNNDSFSFQGGDLLNVTVSGNTFTTAFDVTNATEGQSPTLDSTGNVIWRSTESPLTFEQGLTRTGDVVKMGGGFNEDIDIQSMTGNSFNVITMNPTTSLLSAITMEVGNAGLASGYIDGGPKNVGFFSESTTTTAEAYLGSVSDSIKTIGYTLHDDKLYIDRQHKAQGAVVQSIDANGTVEYTPYTLPTAVGTEGQVMKVDVNGNIVFGEDQSDLIFQNGLTNDGGVIKLGGVLTGNTEIQGDDFSTIWRATDTLFTNKVYSSTYGVLEVVNSNGADSVVKIRFATASGQPPEVQVGDFITMPSAVGTLPAGIYEITNISTNLQGANTEIDYSINYQSGTTETVTPPFYSATFQKIGASGGNVYVGQKLHIGFDNPNSVANYSPAIMANSATGEIGFAPYTLPNSVGTQGQILKVNADGNLEYAAPSLDLTFENGLIEGAGVVKLGGSLTQNTSINLAGNDFFFSGQAGQAVQSTIDFEFLNANVGPILRASDGTKWRVGANSFGNGSAALTLTAVV